MKHAKITCQPWLLLILSVATLIKDRTTQFLNAIKLTPAVTSRDSACIVFFKPTAKMVGMASTNKEQDTKQRFCQKIMMQCYKHNDTQELSHLLLASHTPTEPCRKRQACQPWQIFHPLNCSRGNHAISWILISLPLKLHITLKKKVGNNSNLCQSNQNSSNVCQ